MPEFWMKAICLTFAFMHISCVLFAVWYLYAARRYFIKIAPLRYTWWWCLVWVVPQHVLSIMLSESLVSLKSMSTLLRSPYVKWVTSDSHYRVPGVQINDTIFWNLHGQVTTDGVHVVAPYDVEYVLDQVNAISDIQRVEKLANHSQPEDTHEP